MRTRILLPAVAALCLAGTGVAAAQDTPAPVAIEVGKACGTVTLTFTGPASEVSGTHGFRWNAVNGSVPTAVGSRTGTVEVAPSQVVDVTIPFPEDEFDGVAAVTVAVMFGPNTHLQVPLDIYPVDTDCLPPAVDVEPDTEVPATTAVTPTPDIEDTDPLYETCADARNADAAPLLRGDPGYATILDSDDDGIACEVAAAGTIPVGSIDTGA